MSQRARALVGLAALVAVGAGLLVAVRLTARPPAPTPQAPHDGRLVNPYLPGELGPDGGGPLLRVMAMTVRAGDQETKLRLGSEGWVLESPVVGPADPTRVSGMTLTLEEGHTEVLDEDPTPEALARYGLSPPRFSVDAELKVAGQSRRVGFEGGVANSFDDTVFVRRKGERRVLTAPRQLEADFNVGPAALRDPRIFAVREVDVARVEVLGPGGWAAERTALREWVLTRPDAGAADHLELTHWLGDLSGRKAASFADGAPPSATPALEVVLTMADLTTVRVRFSEADGGTLGRRDSEDFVATGFFPGPLDDLRVAPQALVDRRLVVFEVGEVARVELRDGPARAEAQRVDGGWRLGGEVGPAAGLNRLLGKLQQARGLRPPVRPADWASEGLKEPRRVVRLHAADGGLLGEVGLGGEVPGAPGVIRVRVGARLLEVDEASLGWPLGFGALR